MKWREDEIWEIKNYNRPHIYVNLVELCVDANYDLVIGENRSVIFSVCFIGRNRQNKWIVIVLI